VATLILPFLLGTVLGARFRVSVLFPAIGIVVLIALLACLVGGQPVSAVAVPAAIAISCIQVGYFAGMLATGLSSGQAVQAKTSQSA
jgi:hypothetical protein